MELKDLLRLTKNEIDEVVKDYLSKTYGYRYNTSFEDYLDNEKYICKECGEVVEELYDTEEKINGGIGYICEQCCIDRDISL